MIRGLIFDMDGVLVDNADIHTLAWQQLGKEYGIDLRPETVRAVFGQRNREMMTALLGMPLNSDEQARLARRKEILYRQLMAPVLKPTPGAIDFLTHAKNSGFKTAVATSGPIESYRSVRAFLNPDLCEIHDGLNRFFHPVDGEPFRVSMIVLPAGKDVWTGQPTFG